MPRRHFLCFKFGYVTPVPIILDLVEDKVRNRYYTALLVMVAVTLTFSLVVATHLIAPQDYNDDTGTWRILPFGVVGERFSRTEVQIYLLVIAVLLIPVFMANSLWHRSWWMIAAVPLLAVLVFVAYDYIDLAQYYHSEKLVGLAKYILMSAAVYLVTVSILIIFFLVLAVDKLLHLRKQNRLNYSEKKTTKSYKYTKARLPIGSRNFENNIKKRQAGEVAAEAIAARNYHIQQLEVVEPQAEEPKGFQERLQSYCRMVKDLVVLGYQAIVGELRRVLSEMGSYLKDLFTLTDEFYYPQRLLVSAFISFLTAFLMVLFTLYLNDQLYFWISRVAFWLKQAIAFADQAGQTSPELPDSTFVNEAQDAEDNLRGVYANMLIWRNVLYKSGIASTMVAFVISLVSLPVFMNTYRKHIRMLRQGKYFFERQKFTVLQSPNFIGIKTIHCGFGFMVLWIIFQLIVTFLTSPFTGHIGQFVSDNYFVLFISPLISYLFVNVVIRYYCLDLDGRTIYHRRYWSVYEFLWVFYYVISAFSVAILRFALAQLTMVVRYINTNSRMYSAVLADAGYSSYISMLINDHQHNNPILRCFVDQLKQTMIASRTIKKENFAQRNPEKFRITIKTELSSAQVKDDGEMDFRKEIIRKQRIINRWWLLITLYHNPSLVKERRYPYRPPLLPQKSYAEFVLGGQGGSANT